jgi:hypothetical protein
MPDKLKIAYKDGTTETVTVPTPEERHQYEENIINSIPDDLLKMFGTSKKALLKSMPKLDK